MPLSRYRPQKRPGFSRYTPSTRPIGERIPFGYNRPTPKPPKTKPPKPPEHQDIYKRPAPGQGGGRGGAGGKGARDTEDYYSGLLQQLGNIGGGKSPEFDKIRQLIRNLQAAQRRADAGGKKQLADWKAGLDEHFKKYQADLEGSWGDLGSYSETVKGDKKRYDDLLTGFQKSQARLGDLSKLQQKRSQDLNRRASQFRGQYDALLKGQFNEGKSAVDISAKQNRARDLRSRARLLNSLSRSGASGSVRDYLSQVESSDVDALQATASARATEYYQRRAQLSKELSNQALAENYYNNQASEALSGAAQTQMGASDSYSNILASLAQNRSVDQTFLMNRAREYNIMHGNYLTQYGNYGKYGMDLWADIGQRSIDTAKTAGALYGEIGSQRLDALGRGLGAGYNLLNYYLGQGQLGLNQEKFDFERYKYDQQRKDLEKEREGAKKYIKGRANRR